MIHIDLKKARELIKQAVEERGEEYVYSNPHSLHSGSENYDPNQYSYSGDGGPNCLYIHKSKSGDITPGCGFGLALINAGIPAEWFDSVDRNSNTARDKLIELQDDGLITFTDDASYYLRRFQCEQDDGSTWGAARASAERIFSE